jgi:glyoxylase-like metal-dependent hydrolase (beta-lactamase superfamily II)
MKLTPILADEWGYDGGVAFGVIPKTLWSKVIPSDENNMLKIVDRCLLVEQEGRIILIDAGMGRKREEKFYRYRSVNPSISLENSLAEAGFSFADITDVVFSHLHDDHVGGATAYNELSIPVPVFPNATFWCSRMQWDWAMNPNIREAASYLPDNLLPLWDSGRLQLIEKEGEILPGISISFVHGHTSGNMLPKIDYAGRKVVFMGDFIPTIYHIPIVWVASVDIEPLLTYKEKERFLKEAVEKKYLLFFEHDHDNMVCTVKLGEKGVAVDEVITLDDLR